MTAIGTKLPFRDVRDPVATGGKADLADARPDFGI